LASKTKVDVLDLDVLVVSTFAFVSSSTPSEAAAAVLLAEVDARRRTAGAPPLLGGPVSVRVLLHDDDDDDDAEAPPYLSRAAGRIGVFNAIEDCSSHRNSSSTLPKERAMMIVASGWVILVVGAEVIRKKDSFPH
jgi:hypothetical protein